jgi:hypothetical protein
MLSIDKHCEMLSNSIRDKSAAMYDGFKLFIQMFSGVVGGSVLLRVQHGGKVPYGFVESSNMVAAIIVITTAIIIWDHYRSWHGYRVTLHELAGTDDHGKPCIPKPRFVTSGLAFSAMLVAMAFSLLGFVAFNPLQIPN